MHRYFFNLRAGSTYLRDDQGQICSSLLAAAAAARAGAWELLKELVVLRQAPALAAFEVTDQRGRLRVRIPFTAAQERGSVGGLH